MIALIKTFTLQKSSVNEQLHGVSASFSVKMDNLSESLGGNGIANAFSVQMDNLTDSLGGNKVAGSFVLAHGGYEMDGVVLPKELDNPKLIRQK